MQAFLKKSIFIFLLAKFFRERARVRARARLSSKLELSVAELGAIARLLSKSVYYQNRAWARTRARSRKKNEKINVLNSPEPIQPHAIYCF